MESFRQMLVSAEVVTTGSAFTMTRTLSEFTQPLVSVTVTVYVVAVRGLAIGSGMFVCERPVPGLQAYVFPPEAFSCTPWPVHTDVSGPALAAGRALIFILNDTVSPIQPIESVSTTEITAIPDPCQSAVTVFVPFPDRMLPPVIDQS